jgi:hypothetical protein
VPATRVCGRSAARRVPPAAECRGVSEVRASKAPRGRSAHKSGSASGVPRGAGGVPPGGGGPPSPEPKPRTPRGRSACKWGLRAECLQLRAECLPGGGKPPSARSRALKPSSQGGVPEAGSAGGVPTAAGALPPQGRSPPSVGSQAWKPSRQGGLLKWGGVLRLRAQCLRGRSAAECRLPSLEALGGGVPTSRVCGRSAQSGGLTGGVPRSAGSQVLRALRAVCLSSGVRGRSARGLRAQCLPRAECRGVPEPEP